MENFFVFLDKYEGQDLNLITNVEWEKLSSSSTVKNKHIQKVMDSSKVIQEINADIYILTEMGGRESLNNFNKLFLNNEYQTLLKDGNSSRGIEIGFLVKQGINVKVASNKNIILGNGKKFSRSIAELRIFNEKDELQKIILGVHLKSKIHGEDDFEGIEQRTHELNALKTYILELRNELNVPILVGGDFNCSWNDYEFTSFADGLFEFHKQKNSTEKEFCTFVNFRLNRVLTQIDFVFSTDDVFDLENCYTYRFKDSYGYSLGIPDSFEEKKYLPSDHFPLVAVIK